MPRPKQRRRRPPPRPQQNWQSRTSAAVEATAQGLAESLTPPQLQDLIQQRSQEHDEADRLSQDEPSPYALARYRASIDALAAAKRALSLATEL